MKSNLFRLNLQDMGHGLIMAVGVVFFSPLLPILSTGAFPDTVAIKQSLASGIAAGLVYLGKNLFTNSDGEIGKPETDVAKLQG